MRPPTPASLRDRLRSQLADLKMPGALEALNDILRQVDSGQLAAGEAVGAVLGAQIRLRNQRRLQMAMRSAHFPRSRPRVTSTLPSSPASSASSWTACARSAA